MITSVELADVEAWRKAILARRNLIIVSAGPLTRRGAAALADRMVGDLPAESQEGEPVPFTLPPPRARTIVIERPVEQSVIVAGGPVRWASAGADGAARAMAMSVLGGGFRSRLYGAIREKLGAAYGASAGVSPSPGRTAPSRWNPRRERQGRRGARRRCGRNMRRSARAA